MTERSQPGSRLAGAVLGGALLALAAVTAAGYLLAALPVATSGRGVAALRGFLAAGGWLWVPCWGAAGGALACLRSTRHTRERLGPFALAVALASLPLIARPVVPDAPGEPPPRTRMAKVRAIRRWSYQSPAALANVIALSSDRDADVREQAALALGVNVVVTDIEHPAATRPSRYARDPMRAALRARLVALMRGDSVEAVRAEAARGLWNAPLAFGRAPEAADTLAAVLGRVSGAHGPERLAWLALDAAAGPPDARLEAAALDFARATPDTALAAAARRAARRR